MTKFMFIFKGLLRKEEKLCSVGFFLSASSVFADKQH